MIVLVEWERRHGTPYSRQRGRSSQSCDCPDPGMERGRRLRARRLRLWYRALVGSVVNELFCIEGSTHWTTDVA